LAKRKVLSGKDVCAILERFGFREVRRRGSHIVMQKRIETSTITVPVPDHVELKPGTMASIIRQSGLDKQDFQ
jgi:predicted RNA binding protein YcfA (HicA-like mRNA interferase family)